MTCTSNGRKLTVARLAEVKRLPLDFLTGLGVTDTQRGVGIPYYDAAGNELFVRERLALEKSSDGDQRFRQPKGVAAAAYGQERLHEANKAGFIILVEGESDCWALWFHGLPALGLPGSNAARRLEPEMLDAIGTVYIHREPDKGGAAFVAGVCARLKELDWQGKAFVLTMPDGVKDPADLHVQDADAFEKTLLARIQAAIRLPLSASNDGATRPKAPPKLPDPYRPFPVDALPEPIRSFVIQGAASIGCDPVYLALPALSAAAALIGNARTIRLKRDWFEPSVIWTGIVGDSGTLKTPAVSAAVAPLYRLQRSLVQKHKDDLGEYEREKAAFEERKRKAKSADREFTEQAPEKPKPARVVTGDITVECLAGLLADNAKGLLVCRDELGGWLGSFSRYKGKSGATDLPNWLELSRAGTLVVDRKTGDRPSLFVAHAAVSVCGGIQPGALARAMTPEFMEAGLGARILMAMPPKRKKVWSDDEIDPLVSEAYEKVLGALRDLPLDHDKEGDKIPFAVRMTPEAKAAWIEFYAEWAAEQADADGDMAAALSKLEGYAARLALVHHVVGRVGALEDCQPVEEVSIKAGVELVRWFAYEARRIYSALVESDDDRQTRRLVDFIRGKDGRITARELQHSNSRRYPNADAAEAALEDLVTSGVGEWLPQPTTAKGGQPTHVLSLICLPTPDTTDRTPASLSAADARVPTVPSDRTQAHAYIPVENGGSVGSVGCRLHSNGQSEAKHGLNGLCRTREVVSAPEDTKEVFPPDQRIDP